MKWMQFLTPVRSISTHDAEEMIQKTPGDGLTILDVRQSGEYRRKHIPGAVLAPLPQLADHLDRIDPEKPVLVY
ncbi:MAG: rhodanese-like domain-containing protein [Desulfobacterales bacterium]|nr:rhodanese-like domain-containing protein [Desulfobacterales bacterium]